MDAWGWTALGPWLSERATMPVGALFCVIAGPTAGHAWSASAARLQLLSTTGAYLQGISSEEIISTVHARRAPMMHASAGPCPVEHNHAGAHDTLPRCQPRAQGRRSFRA